MNAIDDKSRPQVAAAPLTGGLVLIGLGLLLLAAAFGWFDFDWNWQWHWWPLVLVVLGLVRLVFAATTRARQGGVWLIVIGLWVWANFAGAFGLEWRNSWPLIIVAAGAMTIWRALAEPGGREVRR